MPCDASCKECWGPLPTDCYSCMTAGFMIQPDLLCAGPGCLPTTRDFNSTNCESCSPLLCSACPTVKTTCTTCVAGALFWPSQSTCLDTCLVGWYPDSANNCLSCHPTCENCNGPTNFNCTSCVSPLRQLRADRVCADGFYYFIPDDSCYRCDPSCATCSDGSATDCLTCAPDRYRNYLGDCVTTCPSNTFVNDRNCTLCHSTCLTCGGPLATDCLTCKLDEVLTLEGMCVNFCPTSQFADASKKCQKCAASCKECSGPAKTQCTECFNPETTVLNKDGSCSDCLLNPESDEETCWFNVPLSLALGGQRALNLNASTTLVVSFRSESMFMSRITQKLLADTLQLEVQDLTDSEFRYSFDIRQGNIVLDLFFFKTLESRKQATLTAKKKIVLKQAQTGQAELIWRENKPSVVIPVKKAPDADKMQALSNIGQLSSSASGPMAVVGSSMALISMFAASGLGAPVMKFVRVFKLISRLRLINVFFGSYLELFLTVCGSLYKIGGDPITTEQVEGSPNSRAKLDFYRVSSISSQVLSLQYALYFLAVIIRIYRRTIGTYVVKRPNRLTNTDYLLDTVAEKSQILLFSMVGLDLVFYSIHCLAHLHITNNSSLTMATSYYLAMITLLMIATDLVYMMKENTLCSFALMRKEFRVDRKLKELMEKNCDEYGLGATIPAKSLSSMAQIMNSPPPRRQENLIDVSPEEKELGSPELKVPENTEQPASGNTKLFKKPRRKISTRSPSVTSRNSANQNGPRTEEFILGQKLFSKSPKKPEVVPSLGTNVQPATVRLPGDTQVRGEEESNSSELEKYDQELRDYLLAPKHIRHKLSNPTSEQFFGNGIKLYKLRTFEGRYFNSFSLIKIFCFEPFYVTLQMFPSGQISILLVLQLAYTIWTARAGFKGIFSSKVMFISTLFNELALSVFLITGTIFQLGGGESNFSDSTRNNLQFTSIGVLGVACVIGMLEFLVSIGLSVRDFLQNRKLNKYKQELVKAREEKNLVRVRAVGEKSTAKPSKAVKKIQISGTNQLQTSKQIANDQAIDNSDLKVLDNSGFPGEEQPELASGTLPKDQISNTKSGLKRRRLVTATLKKK